MLDLIIKNAVVLTMAGKGVGLIKKGAVGIKDSEIVCVDDADVIAKQFRAEREIDGSGKILLPGMVDTHCHSYYGNLCRGVLTDLEFFLEQGLAGYQNTLTVEDERIACRAFLMEGVKRGTTTFCDMGSGYDVLAGVHEEFGVRARVAEQIREVPWDMTEFLEGDYPFARRNAEAGLKSMRHLLDTYGTDPSERISAMVGFQALDYVSEELVLELREIARKRHAMIHTHLAQSPYELRQVEKRFGMRSVDAFEKLGLLNEQTLAAHLVYNEKWENEKAAKSGMKMAYCPCSWCEVGVSPPSAQYLHFGGTVGIGTDESAYTGINPFTNMKIAHLNTNIDAWHNQVPNVPMSMFLRMHTIEAANALGMGSWIGSLEPGKKADLILINPKTINMTPMLLEPLTNIPQTLVCASAGTEVEIVIIDGRVIVEDGTMKCVDEEELMAQTQRTAQKAAEAAAEYYKKMPSSEVLERQRWFEAR